jgi:hypothetical protein
LLERQHLPNHYSHNRQRLPARPPQTLPNLRVTICSEPLPALLQQLAVCLELLSLLLPRLRQRNLRPLHQDQDCLAVEPNQPRVVCLELLSLLLPLLPLPGRRLGDSLAIPLLVLRSLQRLPVLERRILSLELNLPLLQPQQQQLAVASLVPLLLPQPLHLQHLLRHPLLQEVSLA